MKTHLLLPGRAAIINPCWGVYKDYDGEIPDSPILLFCASEELAKQLADVVCALEDILEKRGNEFEHGDEIPADWLQAQALEYTSEFNLDNEVLQCVQKLVNHLDELGFPYSSRHEWCAMWKTIKTEAESDKIVTNLDEAILGLLNHDLF